MTSLTRKFQNSRFAYIASSEMLLFAFLGFAPGCAIALLLLSLNFFGVPQTTADLYAPVAVGGTVGAIAVCTTLITYIRRKERKTR